MVLLDRRRRRAEIYKLSAETEKLRAETEALRSAPLKAEREKYRGLLMNFLNPFLDFLKQNELLGSLHAEEAVPLFVKIMEQRHPDNLVEERRPEMTALAAIGPAAVPAVIESVQNAEPTARRRRKRMEWNTTNGSTNIIPRDKSGSSSGSFCQVGSSARTRPNDHSAY